MLYLQNTPIYSLYRYIVQSFESFLTCIFLVGGAILLIYWRLEEHENRKTKSK